MISGRIAATVEAMIRAFGFRPSRSRLLVRHHEHRGGAVVERARVAGGDGAVGLERGLAACASTSIVVPGRGPSSRADDRLGDVDLVALLVDVLVGRRPCTGTISASKWPESRASTARFCEITAHSSCCLARDVAALGDVLGGQAHRDVDVVQRARRSRSAAGSWPPPSSRRRARRARRPRPRRRCTGRPRRRGSRARPSGSSSATRRRSG